MKKSVVLATAVMLAVPVCSFAAAWNVPTNVRIVQKSNTDTSGRIYGNIQSAINSITNASATNPYVVKVMPGVYDLGTGSLQMKEYVDLEGSGPEATLITSSNNNVDGGTCTIGTVLMANNTAVRNIKIENRAPDLGGAYQSIAALVFNNVVAKAEGVSVLTGSDTVAGGQNNGVCTYGSSAHAILNNVNVETHNNSGQSNPIEFMGGKVTLTNSKLSGYNTTGSVDIINNNFCDPNPGTVVVINSTLEATSPSIQGITDDGCAFAASISNSTMIFHGTGNNIAIATGQALSMDNTKIITDGGTYWYNIADPSKIKIVNSLLPGDRTNLTGAKLVNNYDENYNPIPNQ